MTDYLTKDEVQAFLEKASASGPRNELMCRLLLFTGMRIGEMLPLACGDIDVARGMVTLSKVITSPSSLLAKPRGRHAYKQDKEITFLKDSAKGYTGEVFALKPKDAGEKFLHKDAELVKKGLKASQPTRVVPLTDRYTRNLLEKWVEGHHPRDFLFTSQKNGRLTITQTYRIIKKIMLEAGIDRPKAHPHNLRHTFAVHFLKAGGDVFHLRRILGHTQIATTTIYLRFVVDDLQEAMEKAGDIFATK